MSLNIVLIDTSTWLLVLGRKVQVPHVKEKVEQLIKENRAAVTPMVSLELLGGARSKDEFARLKSRLDSLHQLAIGKKEWHQAAQLSFDLRRQGKTIPYTDILIAAMAIQEGAVLLHVDRHFDIMAEMTGLTVDSLVHLVPKNTL
ncbi:MAG: PIN domain nuclease [Dehalococcoidia bacterium]|nr:PIN domain nuclease [Dehalococcoidia bacterium]